MIPAHVIQLDNALRAAGGGDVQAARKQIPWLLRDIAEDAAQGAFARWGMSTVIDENTGEAVLDPNIYRMLVDAASMDATWPIANAGLLHVYGYLLSRTPTPYGLKRERWLAGDLARGLGLAGDAFTPWRSGAGTLLAEVTAALDGHPGLSSRRQSITLTERHSSGALMRTVVSAADDGSVLSYAQGDGAQWTWITAFPLTLTPDQWRCQLDPVPRLRYNAVVSAAGPGERLDDRRSWDAR